ncbi:histone H2B [Nephila pilipes]|uniref:Histone H2B n=1 Tax=Nephila pilipes TaxID=299642 RepID=A0A8X6P813_NEPPI|nr:histone H2B [Nephila pilipes]
MSAENLYADREYERRKQLQYVNDSSFERYIRDVLKMIDENASITEPAMKIMDALVKDMFKQLANGTKDLMEKDDKRTMDEVDVKCATLELLQGEVARHAVSEGTKAVELFKNNVQSNVGDVGS